MTKKQNYKLNERKEMFPTNFSYNIDNLSCSELMILIDENNVERSFPKIRWYVVINVPSELLNNGRSFITPWISVNNVLKFSWEYFFTSTTDKLSFTERINLS